ncbi:MAG: copper homeostasis protein CutC [Clostridia bacterium]|nr:copper homeostasis protein CutC [Clostridia bacterium]
MDNRILVEICCGSAQDVITAAEAGADRAELSSCLYFGGLTPSVGTVIAAKDGGIPIMAMVRPREGGFIYDEAEKRIMLLDAQAMTGAGADGIVFGALTKDGKIDVDFCRRIIEAAEGRETVFHRAFDLLGHNWQRELEKLIDLGVTRVLTSGFEATAMEGAANIAAINRFAGGAIEILPGSGVRSSNLRELCRLTGSTQVHTSAGQQRIMDISESFSDKVSFTPHAAPSAGYGRTMCEAVEQVMREARA